MIMIVNYGLGNVQAFLNIYKRLNLPSKAAETADELMEADKIILPGVGAFDWAMTHLNKSGMRQTLEELTQTKNIPVLGICVGMQMMAERSEEGLLPGLGWIPGEVKRFDEAGFSQKTHLPHMGWNDVTPRSEATLFQGIELDARFYFLHSYYFSPIEADHVLATTEYNIEYASCVGRDNVYGVQFHPEKSHQWGIQLLKNFAEI